MWCAYPNARATDDGGTGRALTLRDVKVPRCAIVASTRMDDDEDDGLVRCSLDIDASGRIVDVRENDDFRRRDANDETRVVECDGAIALPAFADVHTHIDKAHTCERSANVDGSLRGADEACKRDAKHWSVEDCYRRMTFAVKSAYAYGTAALRTHLMSGDETQSAHAWEAFRRLRREWAGKVELQGVSLSVLSFFRDEVKAHALARMVKASQGVLGCAVSCSDAGGTALDDVTTCGDEMPILLDVVFSIAKEYELDLDFHVDENGNIESKGLLHIARAAIRNSFTGSIVCGHCCSLAVQPEDEAKRIIDATREANITVVSLPQVNQWLQNRDPIGMTPLRRGVTRIKELARAGVPVCLASDNTRDQFFAYGDCDMLEVLRTSIFIAHLDRPIGSWPLSVGAIPGMAMKLEKTFGRIAPGARADFILFHARSYSELFSRSQHDRVVIRNGVRIEAQLPEYSELDDDHITSSR